MFLQRAAGNRAIQSLAVQLQSSADDADGLEREADNAADHVVAATGGPVGGGARAAGGGGGSAGEQLPVGLRTQMEGAFGWDLSAVRLHRDAGAATRAADHGAKAYTEGNDVHLGHEAQDLSSSGARRTLAHELAHTIQQGKGATEGAIRRPNGLAAGLSPAARRPMAAPTVTAVNVPAGAAVGAGGRGIAVTAVAAGGRPLTWTLVGAPAGVTIASRGRRGAVVTASAASAAGAGGVFQVQAALTGTPGDNAVSANVVLVGITGVTFTPQPAFAAAIASAVPAPAPPANSIDPNRDGVAGNSGLVNIVIAPAGRATTIRLTPTRGATVAGTTITPGAETGLVQVQVQDTGTGARMTVPLTINPVPVRVSGFTNGGAAGAGNYGQINNISFAASHGGAAALTRVIGETIGAAGRDDMNLVPTLNGTGPNPTPNLGQAAPGNNWPDNVFTGQASIDVNQFVGPGAPGLPAVSDDRQGMHWIGWSGNPPWSNEIAHGIQRVSLIQVGNAFFVRTDQIFGGVQAPPRIDPYAAVNPLITFTNIAVTPNAPAARGLAADGVAQAGLTFVSSTPARPVNLTLLSGSMAFTTGLAGVAVAGPHTLQAGLVAMKGRVRIADATFANRRGEQVVSMVPVTLGSVRAPASVPAGTPTANITVNAAPGGRTLIPTVDTPGFVVAQVAPPVVADPARQITVTRPGPGPATVRVTITDSILAAKSVTVSIRFR